MIKKSIKNFFDLEAATGILLAIATVFALLIANSSGYKIYYDFFAINLPINFFELHQDLTIRDWINDFLMAIFFFLIGLELKKEILIGELSSRKKVTLPLIAACGGVILPAIIFVFFNFNDEKTIHGFAVPTATDIAFAYGMISLFGKKFSSSLKVFLITLAVIDDLIAILIIAIFYSGPISVSYFLAAFVMIGFLTFLNLKKSNNIALYLIFGIITWFMVLKSGLHATLAGVILAFFIPLKDGDRNLLKDLAKKIAPTVNFLIMPLFAFANAGVEIKNFSVEIFSTNLILGIILALFIGKQLGVMIFSYIAIKLKAAHLPTQSTWFEFYIAAIFTGIGFTMSLFIGSLAFIDNEIIFDEVKIGVLCGSLLSIVYGVFITFFIQKSKL